MTGVQWHSIPTAPDTAERYGHTDHITVLAPDAHHSVDWDRVRATVRRLRPLRALAVLGVGLFPAVQWSNHVTYRMTAAVGVDTAFAVGCLTAVVSAVGCATGGRIRRWASAVLLVAAVGGTLIAEPTRHLIAAWIVGA
ncbi:hypothetical protein ACFWP3_16945 [Streptomyces sp. NPDC058525]|uniref:hypothetical protein n=1 Tax=Streptomyces sp. NPDC058525 TaxID=3346538 RepID=UPI0036534750